MSDKDTPRVDPSLAAGNSRPGRLSGPALPLEGRRRRRPHRGLRGEAEAALRGQL